MAGEDGGKAWNSGAVTASPVLQPPAPVPTGSATKVGRPSSNGLAMLQSAGAPSAATAPNVTDVLRKRLRIVPDGATSRRYENDVTATEFEAIAHTLAAIAEGRTSLIIEAPGQTLIEAPGQTSFKQDLIEILATIVQTQVGRRTVKEVAENQRHTTRLVYAAGQLPEEDLDVAGDKAPYHKDATDQQTGVNAIIRLDPKAPLPRLQEAKRRGLEGRNDIVLFHELVHAHHTITGHEVPGIVEVGEHADAADVPMRDAKGGLRWYTTKEEYATIGIEVKSGSPNSYITSGETENAYRATRKKVFRDQQVHGAVSDAGLRLRQQHRGNPVSGDRPPAPTPAPPAPLLASLVRSLPRQIGSHRLLELIQPLLPLLGQRRLAEILVRIATDSEASKFVADHGAPALLALDDASATRDGRPATDLSGAHVGSDDPVPAAEKLLKAYPSNYDPDGLKRSQKDLSQGSVVRQLRAASKTLTSYVSVITKDVDVFIEDESVFADREAGYARENYKIQADAQHKTSSAAELTKLESQARIAARRTGGRTVGSRPNLSIILNAAKADRFAIIHEYIHVLSNKEFDKYPHLIEGATQYFARKVIRELISSEEKFLGTTSKEFFKSADRDASASAYSDELAVVEMLVNALGEQGDDVLSKEYFQGASMLQGAIDGRHGPGTFTSFLDLLERAEQGVIGPLELKHATETLLKGTSPTGRRLEPRVGPTHR